MGLCTNQEHAKILRKLQSGQAMIKHLVASLVKEEDVEKVSASKAGSQAEPVGENGRDTEIQTETDVIDPELQQRLERECDMMDFVTTESKDMLRQLRLLLAFSAASDVTCFDLTCLKFCIHIYHAACVCALLVKHTLSKQNVEMVPPKT